MPTTSAASYLSGLLRYFPAQVTSLNWTNRNCSSACSTNSSDRPRSGPDRHESVGSVGATEILGSWVARELPRPWLVTRCEHGPCATFGLLYSLELQAARVDAAQLTAECVHTNPWVALRRMFPSRTCRLRRMHQRRRFVTPIRSHGFGLSLRARVLRISLGADRAAHTVVSAPCRSRTAGRVAPDPGGWAPNAWPETDPVRLPRLPDQRVKTGADHGVHRVFNPCGHALFHLHRQKGRP